MFFNIGGGALSESEAEDDPEVSRVTLPQGLSSRGNMSSEQSSVRLVELGPRMTMSLVKIEEGMHDGEVLYHKFVFNSNPVSFYFLFPFQLLQHFYTLDSKNIGHFELRTLIFTYWFHANRNFKN